MFVQTENLLPLILFSATVTEMNSWNIIHGPLIELKRSHNLMFIGTLFQFYNNIILHFSWGGMEFKTFRVLCRVALTDKSLLNWAIPFIKNTLLLRNKCIIEDLTPC